MCSYVVKYYTCESSTNFNFRFSPEATCFVINNIRYVAYRFRVLNQRYRRPQYLLKKAKYWQLVSREKKEAVSARKPIIIVCPKWFLDFIFTARAGCNNIVHVWWFYVTNKKNQNTYSVRCLARERKWKFSAKIYVWKTISETYKYTCVYFSYPRIKKIYIITYGIFIKMFISAVKIFILQ